MAVASMSAALPLHPIAARVELALRQTRKIAVRMASAPPLLKKRIAAKTVSAKRMQRAKKVVALNPKPFYAKKNCITAAPVLGAAVLLCAI
jgi:hypothetical protein